MSYSSEHTKCLGSSEQSHTTFLHYKRHFIITESDLDSKITTTVIVLQAYFELLTLENSIIGKNVVTYV